MDEASIRTVIDSLPFKPSLTTRINPTNGKNSTGSQVCAVEVGNLQDLMRRAQIAYDAFTADAAKAIYTNQTLKETAPTSAAFIDPKLTAAIRTTDRMFSEIKKVLDPTLIEYIKMIYPTSVNADYATVAIPFKTYETELKEIEAIAAKIKKENQKVTTNTTVTNKQDAAIKLDNIVLNKISYDITLYMILPSGEKVTVEQFISEMMYSRNFDTDALPIYSVLMKIPQTIMYLVKEHFENIKWYITIKARERQLSKDNNKFALPEIIINNAELIGIDPIYNPPEETSGSVEGALPIYPVKIDFVPSKDTKLNSSVQANVYSNVRLIDVITIMCDMLRKEYAKSSPDTKNSVKFTIAPPDNTQVYEQILVEPGSFTDVINKLQLKYGIYMTGVRVSFDSVQTLKATGSTKTETTTYVTILDKGGTAPSSNAINNVVVEIVDGKNTEMAAYDSGFSVNKDSNTILLRTYLPYAVIRKNSEKLVNGESVRVMQNSSSDHVISNCDNLSSDTNVQKIYWSNFDNPYGLTQLQDSIREKDIQIHTEIRDINVFTFTDNLKYNVKFYGKDDGIYSGEYRLAGIRFYMRNKAGSSMKNTEAAGVFSFTNVPPLRINGSVVDRQTYGEKISASAIANNSSGVARLEGAGFSSGAVATDSGASRAPYKTNFQGRKDFYGQTIPAQIPDDYKMSSTVTFRDIYATKDGIDYNKATAIANNFSHFINAQRYSKEVLDVLNGQFGKFGVGKLNSFFRYGIPGGGSKTSQHLIALASDAMWSGAGGDSLCDAFVKILKSGIEFDQLILEGNGSQWRWIHVGKQMNGTNRREVKLAPNATAGFYKNVNVNKVNSGIDLSWANWKRAVY